MSEPVALDEAARIRAWRDFRRLGDRPAYRLATALLTMAAAGVAAWASSHSTGAQVVMWGAVGAVAGGGCLTALTLASLVIIAPYRQRDEAREALRHRRQFADVAVDASQPYLIHLNGLYPNLRVFETPGPVGLEPTPLLPADAPEVHPGWVLTIDALQVTNRGSVRVSFSVHAILPNGRRLRDDSVKSLGPGPLDTGPFVLASGETRRLRVGFTVDPTFGDQEEQLLSGAEVWNDYVRACRFEIEDHNSGLSREIDTSVR